MALGLVIMLPTQFNIFSSAAFNALEDHTRHFLISYDNSEKDDGDIGDYDN